MKIKLFDKITSTLRGKLSLWYLASVGLIILLLLTATSILFFVTLQGQIDHHVLITVNEAGQIVERYSGEERDELIKSLVSAQGMTVIVLSPDGAPMLETNSPDVALVTEHQLQRILALNSLHESSPVHFTESNMRFAAKPVRVSAGKGIVAVGYSTQVLYATFVKMLGVVAGILVLLVFPLTYLGYKLLKRQLQPLESIADQARAVSSMSTLSRRIQIPSPTQELEAIQEALNSMLSRLEKIFSSEREFFLDAAHTLKTPLAVLRSQIENSGVTQKAKEELLATIDTTNDTIADLLFLSKISDKSKNITTFSLSGLMIELSELASTLGEDKDLEVASDIEKNVNFRADRKLLQRALSNIMHNAVVYNKPKGRIDLSLKRSASRITIQVADSGIGIKKSDAPLVFNRFFRGSNTGRRGSGLGLAIARAVVESMGGKITLKSVAREGTTVMIKL